MYNPNVLVSGPDPGFVTQTDSEEAQLDVEWAGAVAPGATINLVVAGSTDTTDGVDLAAAYAVDNEVAPILTYTYGNCEAALGSAGNAFYNALWQQAAAEGITVLVASSDNGAAGCDSPSAGVLAQNGLAVNGIAATPYNVAVGGTEFAEGSQASTFWSATNAADYSSALGYIPETVWNESCDPAQSASSTNCVLGNGNIALLASGGGASSQHQPRKQCNDTHD
jgi:large repetitive protein